MNSNKVLIPRRSFLIAASSCLAFGLKTIRSAQTPIERGRFGESDLGWIRAQLLELVNQERSLAGVPRLALDDLACRVGNEHALDMATGKFLSHWGRDGRKPYHRYSFAGGIDAIQENVAEAENIASLTPTSVASDLRDMHTAMHDETAPNDGHRQAILAPQHTHVGFGIALRARSLRLDEMYVARYVRVDPVPRRLKRKGTVVITGRLLNAKHLLRQVNVFYEPLPMPAEVDWLRTPRSYSLPEVHLTLRPKVPAGITYTDGTAGDYESSRHGEFRVPVKLFNDVPGIYTIVFWITRVRVEQAFPATQICISGD